jgi:hypothetical protein
MKKVLFLILIAGGAWWYFIGGRQINETQVRDYYQQQQAATLKRQPQALCDLLGEDFRASGGAMAGGRASAVSLDKKQACDGYHNLYRQFDQLGEKMGGMLQLDYSYTLDSITIAADKKSALVEMSYTLDVAGSVMNIRARSTETLARRNGKTLMLDSDSKVQVSGRAIP